MCGCWLLLMILIAPSDVPPSVHPHRDLPSCHQPRLDEMLSPQGVIFRASNGGQKNSLSSSCGKAACIIYPIYNIENNGRRTKQKETPRRPRHTLLWMKELYLLEYSDPMCRQGSLSRGGQEVILEVRSRRMSG